MDTNRTTEALDCLEAGVKNLCSADAWKNLLKVMSQFHEYSFGNCVLIKSQRPDARKVAGFNTWKDIGRSVKKGEKAIFILAPMTKKLEDEETGETKRKTFFRPVPVFDIAQTDGDPLPSVVNQLEGDDVGLVFVLTQWARSQGLTVTQENLDGMGINGYFDPRRNAIAIHAGLSLRQQAKTLAHELGHSIMHRDIVDYHNNRPTAELEAESTAFVILDHFGLDAGEYSFGYVTTWMKGDAEKAIKTIKESGTKIASTAKTIINGMESLMRADEQVAA